ncbi:MAG: LuxR C-terminal-related transcriptional regulator [Devosia sp.]|nr:LuxR C-terminal-related transcriptional regulator [Devosia sp.]
MGEDAYYHSFLNRDRLVHIVDADPSTCEALSVLFRLEGFQTTFSLDTEAFYAGLERRPPDVVVLNLRIAAEDGVGVLRRVKAMRTGTPVFMVSNTADVEAAVRAMKAWASDVMTKPIDTEHFVRAVLEALRQDVHLGALDRGRRPIEVRGFSQLTPREREVLQLISNGQSNKEAGRELGISPRTIEVHRARVMEKLGAKNTADLMRILLTS